MDLANVKGMPRWAEAPCESVVLVESGFCIPVDVVIARPVI